ncbi:MAG: hypothetical protein GY936_03925 [Ignavibacteriae bacterium]|nr:hypothetical protein [Ignavibacteriota bacterium]
MRDIMGENGNWTDTPDWGMGNFKNYDENDVYLGNGNKNSNSGKSGCSSIILIFIVLKAIYHLI